MTKMGLLAEGENGEVGNLSVVLGSSGSLPVLGLVYSVERKCSTVGE